jgi:hypothetical protein
MRKALVPLAVLAVAAFAAPTFADTPEASQAARRWLPPPPPPEPAFSVDLVDASERELPTFSKSGQRFVMGAMGERYRIRVQNPSSQRVEVVVSVDGLDVIDGADASTNKRGYVIPAFGDVTIDGWRTSADSVAAFRFASVRDSYAARTGSSRNVGVIGVAFFRERQQEWRPRPWASGAGGSSRRAAPAPNTAPKDEEQRKGLGTEFGEQHDSHVNRTTFERASSSPTSLVQLRYDDREGLRAIGIQIPERRITRWDDRNLRDTADPFPGQRFAQPPPGDDRRW